MSCVNVLCNVLLLSPNKQLPLPTLYQVQQVAVALFMSGRNTEDSVVQRAAFTSRSQKLADPLNASVPASLHAQINPRPRSTSVAAQAPSVAAQNNPQPPYPYRAHHHISTQSIQKKLQKNQHPVIVLKCSCQEVDLLIAMRCSPAIYANTLLMKQCTHCAVKNCSVANVSVHGSARIAHVQYARLK